MIEYVVLALTLPASLYGTGEIRCGDTDKPVPCASGATTSSGEAFDPEEATAAVPAPAKQRTRPMRVSVKAIDGSCVQIKINDKSHPRWIGRRGLDLTPGALRLLGIEPTKHWSGPLEMCEEGS
jgi:hypothetical protein